LVRNKSFGRCSSGRGGADHKQDGGAKHMWSLQVLEGVNVTRFLSQEPLAISRQEWMTKWMIIRSSQCKALQCIKRIKKRKKLPHLKFILPFVKKCY
jgi:hypothetical protein